MRIDWQEVLLSTCGLAAFLAWHQELVHWTSFLFFATPVLLGILPKLRIALFMNSKRTPAPKVEGRGPSTLLRRTTNTVMALVIPPFRNKRTKSSSFEHSYRSAPTSPLSRTMSPESIGLCVIERLHFNGDRYEFFSKTKFAGCLREEECDELFKVVWWTKVQEGQTLFQCGDSIEEGLFMVVEGKLGVYSGDDKDTEVYRYSMSAGESIGDLDLVCNPDSKRRGVTVRAQKDSYVMQLTQEAWKEFCSTNPHALLLFLRLAIGRLHRVAFFVLGDFIPLPDFTVLQPDITPLPLSSLSPLVLKMLQPLAVKVPMGVLLVEKDDAASSDLVVVLEGEMTPDAPCDGACIVGARAFFTNQNHGCDIQAKSDCLVVRLSLDDLLDLGLTDPVSFNTIISAAAGILLPVIAKFISLGLSRQWIKAGQDVFREGEDADGVYVVITGRVKLMYEDHNGKNEVMGEVGRGDTLGEEAVLEVGTKAGTVTKRIFSARCMRDCELVKISPINFEHICTRYPQVTLRFIKTIARRNAAWQGGLSHASAGRRQRAAGQSKTSNLATIAVIPINGESTEGTREMASALKHDLKKFGPSLLLDEASVRLLLGWETMNNLHSFFYRTRTASWVNQQEEDYRFIILLGDASGSAWSQVCVSQADIVLTVSQHDSLPSMLEAERQLLWEKDRDSCTSSADIRKELVLLHGPSGSLPRMTKLWLDHRPGISLHHHIRLGVQQDIGRLGRHLAGRAVGLVLGGGGARGLAHLGVMRAMEELGVPIDFIGGTSQGAFMGCLYAQKLHTGKMVEEVDELSRGIGSVLALMRDLTLPILSIFSGKSFSATIKKCLGLADIRDCWINFFCITCSVSSPYTTETLRVHRKGIAWKFVRASMSIVGYLPPVYDNGELLVDGGYVNNLPSDEMQKMGVHTVIGVDVEDNDESMYADIHPLKDHVSGWWVLGTRVLEFLGLGGRRGKVPRQSDILSTLCYVSHTSQLPRAKACLDLYLRPPVEGYKLLDYHKKEEIVENAYQYALVALSKFCVDHNMQGLDAGPQWTDTRSSVMPMLGIDRQPSIRESLKQPPRTPVSSASESPCPSPRDLQPPGSKIPACLSRTGSASFLLKSGLKKRTRCSTLNSLSDYLKEAS